MQEHSWLRIHGLPTHSNVLTDDSENKKGDWINKQLILNHEEFVTNRARLTLSEKMHKGSE